MCVFLWNHRTHKNQVQSFLHPSIRSSMLSMYFISFHCAALTLSLILSVTICLFTYLADLPKNTCTKKAGRMFLQGLGWECEVMTFVCPDLLSSQMFVSAEKWIPNKKWLIYIKTHVHGRQSYPKKHDIFLWSPQLVSGRRCWKGPYQIHLFVN